jgi:RNA polymerase sigma-70 factor (ECF subfamily)
VSDETHDETSLVERARGGDADAYGALVKRYSRDAVRVATAITGSVGDAEDAAQTAFVKAYLALDRFRAGAPVRPWLMRIVANEAKNSRRSSQRRERLAERSHERYCVIAPSAEEGAIAGVTTTELLRAVGRLDHRDRAVIAFRFFAEMSEAETALALDCAVGTVKSRLSRAMARLRAELATDLPAAGGEG